MGYKTLELTTVSARDMKKLSLIGENEVYVTVSLSGDPKHQYSNQKTPIGGGSTVAFTVEESSLSRLMVVFRLRHKRALYWDKDVGRVGVWVDYLLRKKDHPNFSCQIRTPSGKYEGCFEFLFTLKDSDS